MTTDLIKRLEDAAEGSRELDLAIQIKFGRIYATWNDVPMPEGSTDDTVVPHYTTSLDAAMTLVPEGWRIMMLAEYYGKWSACLHRAFGIAQDNAIWKSGHHWPSEYIVNGETNSNLALALCIAALKAKDQS